MSRTNRSIGYWLGHLIALALAITMIITLPWAIAARDIGAVVFTQERVHSILQLRIIESGVLEHVLVDALLGERGISGGDEWFRAAVGHLSDPERQEILALVLPEGWIESQISNATESTFAWLESEQVVPDLYIDMQPIKAKLLDTSLDLVVEVFVDSWPSCSPEEVERLQMALDRGGELPGVVCEPPEPLRAYIVDLATRALATETSGIPDRMPLFGRAELNVEEMIALKQSLRTNKALLMWSWLVPLALLGPLMAIKARSRGDLGRWWGIPLAASGVFTVLLNLVLRGNRADVIQNALQDTGPPGSPQYTILDVLLQGAADLIVRLMLLHALALLFAGAAVWFFLRRPREPKNEVSAMDRQDENGLEGPSAESPPRSPPPVPPLEDRATGDSSNGPPSGIFG